MFKLSYWICPIISGVVWLGMLLGLLTYWNVGAQRIVYPSMGDGQTIAYISDIGAAEPKPVFITGCVITTVFLNLSLAADRWLRHTGRLAPNTSTTEKMLSGLAIFFSLVGTTGLILLTIYDVARYRPLHDDFLRLFLSGYTMSAVFICWEYQLLGQKYRDQRILGISFWIKLVFILVEVPITSVFTYFHYTGHYNVGALLEWTIAFIFSLYVFSFGVDLWPAACDARPGVHYEPKRAAAWADSESTICLTADDGLVPYELRRLGDHQTAKEVYAGEFHHPPLHPPWGRQP